MTVNVIPEAIGIVRCGVNSQCYALSRATPILNRGDQILCRTLRGIEIADVLVSDGGESSLPAAKFIRKLREQDHYLWDQLVILSQQASDACQKFLVDHQLDDVLLEVEPLFDGKTLVFHFVGEPCSRTESYVQELASVYQQSVARSRFAQLLEKGCGPGCGTKDKSCGTESSGCAVCAVAGGCSSKAG